MQNSTTGTNDNLVEKCEILSLEEQIRLWKKYKEYHDRDALEKLIFCHLRFAYSVVDSLNNRQFREELKAEAYYAIIKAIEFWDPEKGRLTTIIMPMVRQAASKYLREVCKTIRVPVTAQNFYKEQALNNENYDHLTKRQKIKLDRIAHIENMKRLTPRLIAQIEGGDISILEKERIENKEILNELLYKISLLDSKSKYIVEHYFGIKEPKETLTDIGKKLGLHRILIKKNLIQAIMNIKQMGHCLWCGKTFIPSKRFKYHCCVSCMQLELSTRKAQYVICRYCQKLFIPTIKYRKYCCTQCKTYAQANRRAKGTIESTNRHEKTLNGNLTLEEGCSPAVGAENRTLGFSGSCTDAHVEF